MSRLKKLVAKILQNPKHVSFEDLDKILREFGYERRQPGKGSSHYVYRKKDCKPITVPKKKPFVKEYYVKKVIDLLELEDWYEETRSGKAG